MARMHHARRHRIEAEDTADTPLVRANGAGLGIHGAGRADFKHAVRPHAQPPADGWTRATV